MNALLLLILMANITIEDNGWTLATEQGPARTSAPFPNINAHYLLEQDFMQDEANYTPLALNTPHATKPTYFLVEEKLIGIEGGVRTWTRAYAQVPASWTDVNQTINYNFIGFYGPFPPSSGATDPTTAYGRLRRTFPAKVKSVFDYFLVGIGGSYALNTDIPINEQTEYRAQDISGQPNPVLVDAIWDTTTVAGSTFAAASNPSLATYKTWMTADVASASSFSIVAQTSIVSRWKGNIFQRQTLYIKAI